MPFIRRRPLDEEYSLDPYNEAPESGLTPYGRELQDQLDTLAADTNVRLPRREEDWRDVIGRGASKVYEGLNYPILGRPLDALKERAFASAEEPNQSEALRYLKRYGGALAETAAPLTSPLGIASFLTGGVGTVARGVLGAEQIAGGVPEIVAGAREGDWKRAGTGALSTGLGALMAAEPVRVAAGLPAAARAAESEAAQNVFDLQVPLERAGVAGIHSVWAPKKPWGRGRTLREMPAWKQLTEGEPPPHVQEAEILNPQLPPYEPSTRFYAGRAGVSEGLPVEAPGGMSNAADWTRPRGELPRRAGPSAIGLPPEPPMTPAEYLRQAELRQGDPLAELELALRAENVDIPGPRQGPMPEFRPEWPMREGVRGREPAVQQPEVLGQPEAVQAPKADSLQELADALRRTPVAETPPARPVAPDVLPERVPPPGPGVEPTGGVGRGVVPGGTPGERVGPVERPSPDLDAVEQLMAEARAGGFAGDEGALRGELSDKFALMQEVDDALKATGKDPKVLLQAVADNGGISWDSGLPGELAWLREGQDPTGRGLARGSVGGVRGVFPAEGTPAAQGGKSFDQMLEALSQDPKFSHIQNLDDLTTELGMAVRSEGIGSPYAKAPRDIVDRLRSGVGGGRFWEPKPLREPVSDVTFDPVALEAELSAKAEPPAVPSAVESSPYGPEWREVRSGEAFPPGGEFKMDVTTEKSYVRRSSVGESTSEPPVEKTSDVLNTGEIQSRFPGDVGAVREQNVQTPQFEAPFSLARPVDQGVRELEQALFKPPTTTMAPAERAAQDARNAVARAEAERQGPAYLDAAAVEAGRQLERRVQRGVSPTGVERRAAPTPEELGGAASQDMRTGGGLPGAMTPTEFLPPEPPVAIPNNVKSYLIRQLGYAPEQVAAMTVDEAVRIGKGQIKNPTPVERVVPVEAPIEPLPGDRAEFPDIEARDQAILERMKQRNVNLARKGPVTPPHGAEPGPMPRSIQERAAAGEQLTMKERASLGLPKETPPAVRPSLREQGVNPRAIERRAQSLDSWMADPTPENFARWAQEVSGQAERYNAKVLKGGTGEAQPPPRSPSGEVLYSGFDPSLLTDPKMVRHLRDFFFADDFGNLWARRAVGAGVGAAVNPDNRFKGALAGFLAATYGPAVARGVASDVAQTMTRGWGWWKQDFGALPKVYEARTPKQDIGLIERYFGSKAHTISEEFASTRPGVEAWGRVKATGKIDSRTPLLEGRFGEGEIPRNAQGQPQVQQSTFLKPEISYLRQRAKTANTEGRRQAASYLSQYADELAGMMTRSERLMRDAGIPLKRINRLSTEISNQIYRTGLAFHSSSASVNRTTQPLLATPYTGFKTLWKAYGPLSEGEKGLSQITRPIDMEDVGRPALHALDKFDEYASWMMRATDNQNRQGVYAAAFKTAKATGATDAEAHLFGRSVSEKTQGLLGMLSGNPSWRGPVMKTIKPFTKFPTLFVEWANDIALATDPRIRWRTAALAGAAMAFSQATGIDLWDMLAGGARYGGSNMLKAAMDVYAHATNQAKDHQLLAAPGSGFLNSDVGSIVYPIGVRKTVDLAKRFARQGLGPHTTRTPSGTPEQVTAAEDFFSTLAGIRTQRQNTRRDVAMQAYEQTARQTTERMQASAQAKRDYYAALDAGDETARQDALRRMSPSLRKSVLKMQNLDRLDRIIKAAPKKDRPALRRQYEDPYDELGALLESR